MICIWIWIKSRTFCIMSSISHLAFTTGVSRDYTEVQQEFARVAGADRLAHLFLLRLCLLLHIGGEKTRLCLISLYYISSYVVFCLFERTACEKIPAAACKRRRGYAWSVSTHVAPPLILNLNLTIANAPKRRVCALFAHILNIWERVLLLFCLCVCLFLCGEFAVL